MDPKKIEELPRNNLPNSGIIAVTGVCSVALLIALIPAFNAYYDGMFNRAVSERLESHDDRAGVQRAEASWAEAQRTGRMPLEQAMAQLGERGRRAFPQISPQSGGEMNLAPLTGWAQNEQELPASVVRAQQEAAQAAEAAAATEAAAEAERARSIEAGALEGTGVGEGTTEASNRVEPTEAAPAEAPAPRRRRRRAAPEGADGAAPAPAPTPAEGGE